MGVKFNENPDDAECISCMACMHKACKFGAINIEIGGLPLKSLPRAKGCVPQETAMPIN
jgi:ferredoxin